MTPTAANTIGIAPAHVSGAGVHDEIDVGIYRDGDRTRSDRGMGRRDAHEIEQERSREDGAAATDEPQ